MFSKEENEKIYQQITMRFNPCCNGMFSKVPVQTHFFVGINRFNPCCNGMFSKESNFQLFTILF